MTNNDAATAQANETRPGVGEPAEAAQAVKGEVIGFRVRMKGSTEPWTTVYDRAPDTWELRDGEIQNIYLAPPEPTLIMNGSMRDALEGMSVSIDVSTSDHDAGHRLFGTISEVMDCPGDKHGVTLLVQGAEPNFGSKAHLPEGETSGAEQRRQPYVPVALVDAALQAAMAHNSANPARKGFSLTADEMRAGLAAAFAAMPQQIGTQDHLDLLQSFVVRSRRIMGADSVEAAQEALKAIDRLQLRETHRNSKSSARTPFAHRCRAWRVVFREPGIPAGAWTDGEPPEHMYERARKHDFTIQAAFDMRPEPGSAPGWFWVPLNPGAEALLPLDRFMRPSAAQELWEILLAGMPQPPVADSPGIPASKPQDGGRQPTGAMQLPEDRPGVYIRGEDAAAFAQALRLQLEDGADGGIHPIYSLESFHRLIALLDSVARTDR